MAIKDRNGALHSEKNGQFVSNGESESSGFDVENLSKEPRGRSGTIVIGRNESAEEKQIESSYDMNALTAEIEADPENASRILRQAIADGRVNTRVHKGHQDKHIVGTQNYKQELANGREPSILTVDHEALIEKHAGQGVPLMARNNRWTQCESFADDKHIGVYNNKRFNFSKQTCNGRMHYSNKGVHIVPDKENDDDKHK